MSHQFACFFCVRFRRVAAGIELLCTEETVTAGNDKRHHNSISFFELRHRTPYVDDDAHGLMPKHVAFFHSHHKSIVKMEVRSANRGRGDLDNRVCRFLNLGIGNRIDADVVFTMPTECSNSNIFFKLLTAYRCVDPRAESESVRGRFI